MGKYFTINELCHSNTAIAQGIDNKPGVQEKANLELLIKQLDVIREAFGKPIMVTSGYRCPELNRKVKGVANSYHVKGLAVDLDTNDNSRLLNLIHDLADNGKIALHKIINEYPKNGIPSWIHLQISLDESKNINNRVTIG